MVLSRTSWRRDRHMCQKENIQIDGYKIIEGGRRTVIIVVKQRYWSKFRGIGLYSNSR